jgi:UDP-2,3-diacylglucosamine pyrophosphatase LpxH
MGRTVLLSDLHMGAGGQRDQFRADAALTVQLDRFAQDPAITDLVLLGDTFDLTAHNMSHTAPPRAARRLGEVLDAHPIVVSSLRSVVRMGVRLHFVHGNHDVELADVQVQTTLRSVLAAQHIGGVNFLPWLYHVPGLLLAEHGNQYHDLNAFDTVLRPLSDDGRLVAEPFGSQLSRLRGQHGPTLLPRAAWAAVRELVRLSGPSLRARRSAYREELLPPFSAEVGLDEDRVRQLDRLGQHPAGAIVARVVRRTLRPRGPGYLVGAAHAVREVLGDASPPFLVMGHSHGADARLLHSDRYGTPVIYLNTGAWSLRGPRPRDATLPPVTRTWVEIEPAGESSPACAQVLHLAGNGARTVLVDVDATGHFARASDPASRTVIPHDYVL